MTLAAVNKAQILAEAEIYLQQQKQQIKQNNQNQSQQIRATSPVKSKKDELFERLSYRIKKTDEERKKCEEVFEKNQKLQRIIPETVQQKRDETVWETVRQVDQKFKNASDKLLSEKYQEFTKQKSNLKSQHSKYQSSSRQVPIWQQFSERIEQIEQKFKKTHVPFQSNTLDDDKHNDKQPQKYKVSSVNEKTINNSKQKTINNIKAKRVLSTNNNNYINKLVKYFKQKCDTNLSEKDHLSECEGMNRITDLLMDELLSEISDEVYSIVYNVTQQLMDKELKQL